MQENFILTLFGWKIEKIELKKAGETTDYWMISTSSNKGNSSEKSFHLDGVLIKRQHTQQPNLNYISLYSIDEYSNKVKELGGKVVLPKTETTDYGFFAVCMDTAWLSLLLCCYYCCLFILVKSPSPHMRRELML